MNKVKVYNIDRNKWISGVSDGLTLPCSVCGKIPKFDYRVDAYIWNKVIPKAFRKGVICLPCLDMLATEMKLDISKHLIDVQFTGINKTIELTPSKIYYYRGK